MATQSRGSSQKVVWSIAQPSFRGMGSVAGRDRRRGLMSDDLVVDRPPEEPGDAEEVDDHPERAVPEVVVRPAVRPGPVVHRHLHDPASLAEQQRTEEAVAPRGTSAAAGPCAREDPDRAAGVADRLAEHPVADPVRPAADHPLRPDVRRVARQPSAASWPGRASQSARQVGRVVLEVGVERRDPVALRRAETGGRRRRLARRWPPGGSAAARDSSAASRRRTAGVSSVEPSSTTTISKPVELASPRRPARAERTRDLVDELRQARRLVLRRHDHRNQLRPRRAGTLAAAALEGDAAGHCLTVVAMGWASFLVRLVRRRPLSASFPSRVRRRIAPSVRPNARTRNRFPTTRG